MRVVLTFDVEVWCDGWDRLDEVFPAQFERYVYGRSRHGAYALPATLEILKRHGLTGVFFVEPLFSARFGAQYLKQIVDLILRDGHDVQLHVHPEWVDEIVPPIIPNHAVKRQHLCYYDTDEQAAIIAFGKQLLAEAGAGDIVSFRAGSYAANKASYEALRRNGIFVDSSMNACFEISGADLRSSHSLRMPFTQAGVASHPVTVFRDGFGRWRPAQVGACSFEELRDAMASARSEGCINFVIVSHNFELLKADSSEPDRVVVRRFERLCAHLAASRDRLSVGGFRALADDAPQRASASAPYAVGTLATVRRYVEQAVRRFQ